MKKIVFISLFFTMGCKVPSLVQVENKQLIPVVFNQSKDSVNAADIQWRSFFADANLVALIDTALKNNYELLSTVQNIEIAKNNIRIKHADLLPKVSSLVGLGLEKTARYTASGAGNASTEITPARKFQSQLQIFFWGLEQVGKLIFGKLHNAKKSAFIKYLKTIEGRKFLITNLVAEVANSYYELLALDNQLDIIQHSIDLQKSELEVVKIQKEAAKVTELAVKQFEAQVYNSESQLYDVKQSIVETENKINFLLMISAANFTRQKNLQFNHHKKYTIGFTNTAFRKQTRYKAGRIRITSC
jgi:outer membrane protein TolC